MPHLTAKSLKATCVLDPASVALVPTPNGQPKVSLTIEAGGRVVRADVNAKSLRRCIATIAESGPDNGAVILQGKLEADGSISESGIVAQPKVAKPVAEAAAAYSDCLVDA
jgi:hypothetical protein